MLVYLDQSKDNRTKNLTIAIAAVLLDLFIGIENSVLDPSLVKKYLLRMETVTQELLNATNANTQLKAQLDAAQSLISSYQNGITSLNESLSRQQDEISAFKVSHQDEIAVLNESLSRQQDEIEALEASHSVLNESNSKQQDAIITLEASHVALNSTNSIQQDEIAELNASQFKQQNDILVLNQTVMRLQSDFTAFNETIGSSAPISSYQTDIAALNETVQVQQYIIGQLQDDMTGFNQTCCVSGSSGQLNDVVAINNSFFKQQDEIASLNETVWNQLGMIIGLQTNIIALNQTIASSGSSGEYYICI